jgi:hypothetical protein
MKSLLFRKVQPLLEPYGIKDEKIIDAIEKSFEDLKGDNGNVKPWLRSLVFRRIFDEKCSLWIDPRTQEGTRFH